MQRWQKASLAGLVTIGIATGIATAQSTGLTSWKSGLNHDRIIQIQNEGGTREAVEGVEIAYFLSLIHI